MSDVSQSYASYGGGARRAAPRALLGALAIALAGGAIEGCTVIANSSDTSQCSTNEDCTNRAGAFLNSECDVAQGVCVAKGSDGKCTTNLECTTQTSVKSICRNEVCQPLAKDSCTTVTGNSQNSEFPLILGAVLPLSGDQSALGRSLEVALRIAVDDFSARGLLPSTPATGTRGRPLVLVGCDDANDPARDAAAANHLIQDLGVSVIIGGATNQTAVSLAQTTVPAGVLLISPSATGPEVSSIDDNGLVWRTAPSESIQADALALLSASLEPQLALTAPYKAAVIYRNEGTFTALKNQLDQRLTLGGQSATGNANYKEFRFTDANLQQNTAMAAANTPHFIFVFGRGADAATVISQTEAAWPVEATYRPYYLLSNSVLDAAVPGAVNGASGDATLRKRVLGTAFGTGPTNTLAAAFRSAYAASPYAATAPFNPFAANAYDAAYLAIYGDVRSSAENGSVTGTSVYQSIAALVPPGTQINVGSLRLGEALEALSSGGTFDFNGASGPLNFFVDGGEAPADVLIYCLAGAGGSATSAVSSGLYFDAATSPAQKKLAGAIGVACNLAASDPARPPVGGGGPNDARRAARETPFRDKVRPWQAPMTTCSAAARASGRG